MTLRGNRGTAVRARTSPAHRIAVAPLDQAITAPAGHVAVVPGAEVPLLALDLPAGLRGQAREQVARRQLRDRLGTGGDHIEMRPFFAPGDDDRWTRALVADAGALAGWRARAVGGCRAVLPDYLSLPTAPGLWSLDVTDDAVRVRLGPEDGFSAEPALAEVMLAQAFDAAAKDILPQAVLLTGRDTPARAALEAFAQARGLRVVGTADQVEALGLARPQCFAHGETRFDLRADPRAARARLRSQLLPWRWPAVLLLLALVLWSGAQAMAIRTLEAETRALRAGTEALVRQHFLPRAPLLDMRVQVAQVLARRQAAADAARGRVSPLRFFAAAAQVMTDAGAMPEDLSLSPQDGLEVALRLPDFASSDRLVADLRAAGFGVEMVEARAAQGTVGVRAELRLRPAEEGLQ
ncbi:type II secretion system protein GspL [Sulfitobacter sabulilitoris]|uniref:GspL periplasmic domain-containing protein n=1 Tax=Sulfitobacter sabulilitoris TaxID=2562655 RepID=A0A5S3PC79_9RHOB|nr:type II secretion system protein GspL [Sulfitobacter sabulilitoris]TMM51310.1 hypothetical protein FDT80_15765 [Sulfitobacter sabulilitoris]